VSTAADHPSAGRLPAFLRYPGPWFWAAVAVGAALRLYLAVATLGTDDVGLWTEYASGVASIGLGEQYARSTYFNHPPTTAWAMARIWETSGKLGVEFRSLYRVAIACFGVLNVFLLVRLLRGLAWRWVAGAVYALSPLALTLEGQHGNLDPLVATCILGAVIAAGSGAAVRTGLLIGLSAWIKLPALIAAPALGFALPGWRQRLACAAVASLVAAAPYAWGVWATRSLEAQIWNVSLARFVPVEEKNPPNVFVQRVFGYQGTMIRVPGSYKQWLWGWRNTMARMFGLPRRWPAWARTWLDNAPAVALAAIVVLAFLRRRPPDTRAVGAAVALSFARVYGLVNDCATQYFALSSPLWLCLGLGVGGMLHAATGAFVYGLYALICGDWLLRTEWVYRSTGPWPVWLGWLRDFANLSFLAIGLAALAQGLAREVARARERRAVTRAHSGESPSPGR
jgi:hypothetical protein